MIWGLLFTLLAGLFFLLGILIYKFSKNKKSLSILASACAFIVILGLILFDLLPELLEYQKWWTWIFVLLGLLIVKIIDAFIPHHEHHHQDMDYETLDHQEHLKHISTMTIIALILHNFLEGIGLYSLTVNNLKGGLILLLGIGFHNLPLGMQIGSLNENKKNLFLTLLLVLSSFISSFVVIIFGSLPGFLEIVILAITMGMIFHILVFELLGELINNRDKKEAKYGIIVGIILLIIINCL